MNRLFKAAAGAAVLLAPRLHALALGIMVPAYFYPGASWNTMDNAATNIPIVAILNPDSGPGSGQDPNYVAALANLHHAGGKVIGYVDTAYAARDINLVKTNIDQYVAWYDIDGFFLDEMANSADTNILAYYTNIYQYVEAKSTNYSVTGNPGINTQEAYITQPAADRLMIFENGAGYGSFVPSSWVSKYPAQQFVNVAYTTPDAPTMSNYVNLAVSRNAGWIYITDAGGSDPYDTLPSYWLNEVGLVRAFNANGAPVVILNPAQPADQTVAVGGAATFNIQASGSSPLSYQWFKNNGSIPNATNTLYSIASVSLTDSNSTYYCRITNSISATNSRAATLTVKAFTGTYKTITIDGSMSDWANVPLAYTQPQDTTNAMAYQNIYVCNDSNYLYLRFSIYPPAANPFTSRENIFINADNNDTGYNLGGYASFGSELLLQSAAGYQEKNGGFNEGAINGLNRQAAPASGADFELRISRNATYASDGTPVFTNNTIAIVLEAEDSNFVTQEYAPTNGTGGLHYTFAPPAAIPGPLFVARSGPTVTISWAGSGTLQSCGSLNAGSWTNVPAANSPYSNSVSAAPQYFRLAQ